MRSFLTSVLANAVAIWVATLVVPGLSIGAGSEDVQDQVLTFLFLGLVFGVLNAFVKPVLKLFTFPLYLLTLGLFAFVVNAFLLQVTSWVSEATALTFHVDEFFWSAVLGAVVVTVVSMAIGLLVRD